MLAENILAEQFYPLVKSMVGQFARVTSSRHGIDEIQSDGNIGLVKAIRTFDPTRGVEFRTHCYTSVRSAIIDGFRKRRRNPLACALYGFENKGQKSPCDDLQARAFSEALASAIERLPQRERVIILLQYNEGMSQEEIGKAVLKVSQPVVSKFHSRAIKKLRKIMRCWQLI